MMSIKLLIIIIVVLEIEILSFKLIKKLKKNSNLLKNIVILCLMLMFLKPMLIFSISAGLYLYLLFMYFFYKVLYVYIRILIVEIYYKFLSLNVKFSCLRNIIFHYFGMQYGKKYLKTSYFFVKFSKALLLPIAFLFPGAIIIYLILGVILIFDDFEAEFDQLYLSLYHDAAIVITEKGEKKVLKYLSYIIYNFLNIKTFRERLIYGEDFFFLNDLDYENSFFSK